MPQRHHCDSVDIFSHPELAHCSVHVVPFAPAGVLLLVDSVEGPMPQTRFVTKKALALNKKVGVT